MISDLKFYNPLTNIRDHHDSNLWQSAENYLNVGQRAYHVLKIDGQKILLEKVHCRSSFFMTLLKVFSYCLVIPYLTAISICSWYRKSYQFEIYDTKDQLVCDGVVKDKVDSIDLKPSSKVTAYKIDDVLNELKKAKEKGLKLALYVGRGHDQSIPIETDYVWCSLDNAPVDEIEEGRLHLCMDFNNNAQMVKIRHLFDKVLTDLSVIKFMNYPWETLQKLLNPQPDSELISESWSGISSMTPLDQAIYFTKKGTMSIPQKELEDFQKQEKIAFVGWKTKVGENEAESQYANFLANMSDKTKQDILHVNNGKEEGLKLAFMHFILKSNNLEPKRINHVDQLHEITQQFLLTLFDEVQLLKGPYPYQEENQDEKVSPIQYWTAKSPKTIQN